MSRQEESSTRAVPAVEPGPTSTTAARRDAVRRGRPADEPGPTRPRRDDRSGDPRRGPWDVNEVADEVARDRPRRAAAAGRARAWSCAWRSSKATNVVIGGHRPARRLGAAGPGLRRAAHATASGTRSAPRSPSRSPSRAARPTTCPGPFGRELLARLPVRTPDGRTGHRPARFIGTDGPRWFLRGVVTGKAAVEPEAARALEEVFSRIVVVRGTDARPPRDLLPLTLPGGGPVPGPPVTPEVATFDPLTRGPEITEIR